MNPSSCAGGVGKAGGGEQRGEGVKRGAGEGDRGVLGVARVRESEREREGEREGERERESKQAPMRALGKARQRAGQFLPPPRPHTLSHCGGGRRHLHQHGVSSRTLGRKHVTIIRCVVMFVKLYVLCYMSWCFCQYVCLLLC